MQFCNFKSGLAVRLELLSGLAGNKRTSEGDTAAQPDGAGFDLMGGEGFLGLSRVLARGGDRVENDQNGRAGGSKEGEGIGDRLQIEDRRPTGDQHQIGALRSFESCAVGMRSGIDEEHFAAGLADT